MRTAKKIKKKIRRPPQVGMKPLSERDENHPVDTLKPTNLLVSRNEATL